MKINSTGRAYKALARVFRPFASRCNNFSGDSRPFVGDKTDHRPAFEPNYKLTVPFFYEHWQFRDLVAKRTFNLYRVISRSLVASSIVSLSYVFVRWMGPFTRGRQKKKRARMDRERFLHARRTFDHPRPAFRYSSISFLSGESIFARDFPETPRLERSSRVPTWRLPIFALWDGNHRDVSMTHTRDESPVHL